MGRSWSSSWDRLQVIVLPLVISLPCAVVGVGRSDVALVAHLHSPGSAPVDRMHGPGALGAIGVRAIWPW